MKATIFLLAALGCSAVLTDSTEARNVQLILPISAALEATDIPDRPQGAVKFFFGNQPAPQILTKLGSHIARPRTGAMGKSDQRACHEALLWTLVAMEKRALEKGANAVVSIVTFYQKQELSSATEFQCHVGNVIVSVVLKGELVKVADP